MKKKVIISIIALILLGFSIIGVNSYVQALSKEKQVKTQRSNNNCNQSQSCIEECIQQNSCKNDCNLGESCNGYCNQTISCNENQKEKQNGQRYQNNDNCINQQCQGYSKGGSCRGNGARKMCNR